jgi:hypothetical protein
MFHVKHCAAALIPVMTILADLSHSFTPVKQRPTYLDKLISRQAMFHVKHRIGRATVSLKESNIDHLQIKRKRVVEQSSKPELSSCH